jgi:hypothetical protein
MLVLAGPDGHAVSFAISESCYCLGLGGSFTCLQGSQQLVTRFAWLVRACVLGWTCGHADVTMGVETVA